MRSAAARAARVAAAATVVAACAVCFSAAWSRPAQSAAEALLARSIAFHDPQGHWGSRTVLLTWNGTGADGEERGVLDISIFADGSNWELLCIYCHDDEHSRKETAKAYGKPTVGRRQPLSTYKPFADLENLLKPKK